MNFLRRAISLILKNVYFLFGNLPKQQLLIADSNNSKRIIKETDYKIDNIRNIISKLNKFTFTYDYVSADVFYRNKKDYVTIFDEVKEILIKYIREFDDLVFEYNEFESLYYFYESSIDKLNQFDKDCDRIYINYYNNNEWYTKSNKGKVAKDAIVPLINEFFKSIDTDLIPQKNKLINDLNSKYNELLARKKNSKKSNSQLPLSIQYNMNNKDTRYNELKIIYESLDETSSIKPQLKSTIEIIDNIHKQMNDESLSNDFKNALESSLDDIYSITISALSEMRIEGTEGHLRNELNANMRYIQNVWG